MNRFTCFWCLSIIVALTLLAAAGPEADLIRMANEAFRQGEVDRADVLYAQAAERTTDPGLIAFNHAAVCFQRAEFRDAELHYIRVLEDGACPPERAARAWFNRGVCLLRRGGSPIVYRSAVLCFEHCLTSEGADPALKAEARHNLELAKLLWLDSNQSTAKPEQPNDPPPADIETPPPQGDKSSHGEPDHTNPKSAQPNANPAPKESALATDQMAAGNNTTLPVLKDDSQLQQLSPADAREYLRRAALRLRKEREKMNDALRTPDRAGVRDW